MKVMTKHTINLKNYIQLQFSVQFALIISQTFCLFEIFDADLRDERVPLDSGFIDFVSVSFFSEADSVRLF